MKSGIGSICVALTLVTLLSVSSLANHQAVQSRRVIYECNRDYVIDVEFSADGSSAAVSAKRQPPYIMTFQPTDSGFYYADNRSELRGTFDEVSFKAGRSRPPMTCKRTGRPRREAYECDAGYKLDVELAEDRGTAAVSVNGRPPITLTHEPQYSEYGYSYAGPTATLHRLPPEDLPMVQFKSDSVPILRCKEKKDAGPAKSPSVSKPIAQQNQVSINEASTPNPKKPGIVRFGIVGAGGQSIPDAQVQAANAQLVQMLGGASEEDGYEAILLESKLDVLIRQEAKRKDCDYILFVKELNSTINSNQSSGGNPFNVMRDTIGKAIQIAPDSVSKSKAGSEAQTKVDRTADLLDSVSKTTKKKDRVSIRFSLAAVSNNTEVVTDTLKEKVAAKNGEDILGGVLVEVGNLVLNTIAKR